MTSSLEGVLTDRKCREALNHMANGKSPGVDVMLEKVLPSISNSSQAGFVKGRFIGECIRTIDDVIYFTNHKKRPGIALFLDFKKSF